MAPQVLNDRYELGEVIGVHERSQHGRVHRHIRIIIIAVLNIQKQCDPDLLEVGNASSLMGLGLGFG